MAAPLVTMSHPVLGTVADVPAPSVRIWRRNGWTPVDADAVPAVDPVEDPDPADELEELEPGDTTGD